MALLTGTIAHGQVNRWINGSSGFWETGSNWSAGSPSSAHSLFITNATSKFVTLDNETVDNAPSTLNVSNLTVSAPLGSTNTLDLFDMLGAISPKPLRIANTCRIDARGALSLDTSELRIGEKPNGKLVVNGMVEVVLGQLAVTNSSGDAELLIEDGTVRFDGGTMTVNHLVATNGAPSVMVFRRGTLRTAATAVANTQTFVVGYGTQAALINLLGGTHSFANGLVITNNAALTGCGTITGATINHGSITATCTMASLVFDGPVTNHATIAAGTGAQLHFAGPVVNAGLIDASAGAVVFDSSVTNVNGGMVTLDALDDADRDGFTNSEEETAGTNPLSASSYPAVVEIALSGNDVVVLIASVTGRLYQLAGRDEWDGGEWTDIGSALPGTNGALQLTDPGGASHTHRNYHVRITSP